MANWKRKILDYSRSKPCECEYAATSRKPPYPGVFRFFADDQMAAFQIRAHDEDAPDTYGAQRRDCGRGAIFRREASACPPDARCYGEFPVRPAVCAWSLPRAAREGAPSRHSGLPPRVPVAGMDKGGLCLGRLAREGPWLSPARDTAATSA
jgi:hypothetical protein